MLCPRGPQAPLTGHFVRSETPVLPAAPTYTSPGEDSPPDLWPCPPLFLLPVTTLSFRDKWQLLLDNTASLKTSFTSCCCSVTKLCQTVCDPMDCSIPGFPVHHQLLELVHTYRVSDAIQPSHPVIPFSSCLQSFPASGSFPMSQFFASGGQSIGASAQSFQ